MYDQIVIIVMVITNIIAVVIININVKKDSKFDIFTTNIIVIRKSILRNLASVKWSLSSHSCCHCHMIIVVSVVWSLLSLVKWSP